MQYLILKNGNEDLHFVFILFFFLGGGGQKGLKKILILQRRLAVSVIVQLSIALSVNKTKCEVRCRMVGGGWWWAKYQAISNGFKATHQVSVAALSRETIDYIQYIRMHSARCVCVSTLSNLSLRGLCLDYPSP